MAETEVERLRRERLALDRMTAIAIADWERACNDLKAQVGRVRSLHSESPHTPGLCCCGNPIPCPTTRALDGEVVSRA